METKEIVEKNKKKFKLTKSQIAFLSSQILYWAISAIIIFYFNKAVFDTNDFTKNILLAVTIFSALIIDIILIIINKKEIKIHQSFFILATVLGIVYFIATPFGNGNDEISHFLRVYEISKKYTTFNYEDTSEFPMAFSTLIEYRNNKGITYQDYINQFNCFLMNSEESKDLINEYWNIRLYSPIQYLPQAVGITLGRIVSDNIIVIGMLGRITGFIFWVMVCTYAIKIIPNKKLFLLAICLLPINLFSAVCISGDTVTNAVCILFIAIIYRKVFLKEKVNNKEKVLLTVLGCLIALCKIVYLPFIFLVLLMNKENFKDKKELRRFIIILIVLSIIVGILWLIIGSMNLIDSNSMSKQQVKFILENPFEYIIIVCRTITQDGAKSIFQLCTGNELICNGKIQVYPIISYIISSVLLLSLFINEDEKDLEFGKIKNYFIYLIMLITSALIVTAIYVQWTSLFQIGNFMVLGLQGRYFIPVVSLLIFVVKSKLDTKSKSIINILTFMQLPIIFQIINTFI